MRVGLIGAGSMASALARGWGEPVLCTDTGSGRAQALAAELGGEVPASNRELAERADVVVLAHKPEGLGAVAAEVAGSAKAVVSVLAGRSLAHLRDAFPGTPVARVEPNTPVELRQGVSLLAAGSDDNGARELFERLSVVVELPEERLDAAAGISGVGPAYLALFAEAWVEAAGRHGLPATEAAMLVTETMAGTAALLRERGHDTVAIRREVASPGGTTERGLAALERHGLRAALAGAMDDVAGAAS